MPERSSKVFSDGTIATIAAEFEQTQGRCYLDNAGSALYAKSHIDAVSKDLLNNVYMNPHTDKSTADAIDQVRYLILKHFNTDSSEYSVVFTSGATAALRLVADAFDFKNQKSNFDNGGMFMYLVDNHTSVLGMREIARERNANVSCITHSNLYKNISESKQINAQYKSNCLFAYPAMNNFNGFKYPLEWIEKIRSGALNNYVQKAQKLGYRHWYVLLDAACYCSTNYLDLSLYKPDFVCISFYKIFGYPTGLGALLVRNSSNHILSEKKYFGGGTVDVVISTEDFHVKRSMLHERFEDGTVSFLSILAIKHGLDTFKKLIPVIGNNTIMDSIAFHTFYLAKDLYHRLKSLKHPNGQPAVVLYDDSEYDNVNTQGGIVAFNLLRADGNFIGYSEVNHMANLFGIYFRTGCFCNSGSCERHLKLSIQDIKENYGAGHICGDENDLVNGKPTGCLRVSFGYYNTHKDVTALLTMITKCFVESKVPAPFEDCSSIEVTITENTYENILPGDTNGVHTNDYVDDIGTTNLTGCVLQSINVFPIKSCGSYTVYDDWQIGDKGLKYDREWMIVKDNGVCLTQKTCANMCKIKPFIDLKNNLLTLQYPDKTSISISLDATGLKAVRNASFCYSKVCGDAVLAYDCGDEVAKWISEALQIFGLRLLKQSEDDKRRQKKKNYDQKLLSLNNQAQYLLINVASVRWLASKIKGDYHFKKNIGNLVDRFRGNLIVDSNEEFIENAWSKIAIGKQIFKVEGFCTRCQMVCIDQTTGEKTVEPLRSIAELFEGKMRFGVYLTYLGKICYEEQFDTKLLCNVPVEVCADLESSR